MFLSSTGQRHGEQPATPTWVWMAHSAEIDRIKLGMLGPGWWVANLRPLLNAPVLIAVGAAFDFHSGRVRQAAKWMQRHGFEWFFWLRTEPARLWKRNLLLNPWYTWLVALQTLRLRQVPTAQGGTIEVCSYG